MLCARLAFDQLRSPLVVDDEGIFVGRSRIDPVAHPLLATIICESPTRIAVVVLERLGDMPGAQTRRLDLNERKFDEQLATLAEHPLDFAVLEIDRVSRAICYRASPVISVPVYLVADSADVAIDWDYRRLFAGRSLTPDWRRAFAYIAGISTYGARTLASGIWRSTANAILIATSSGVNVKLPVPVDADGPRHVAEGSDIAGRFIEAIEALIDARPLTRETTAVELSGGMDSGLTALAVARTLGPGVMSMGAQFADAMGDAQRYRRELLRVAGGFDDVSVPAERFAPFAPGSARRERYGVWPEDENYPELFEAIFTLLRGAGIEAVVSGLGGDELYPVYEGESGGEEGIGVASGTPFLTQKAGEAARKVASDYPRAWLQETCWLSAASQSQRLLRLGLWPVMPYLNPALARFTARLPWRYREDRRVLRTALTRLTGDPVFASDYVKERFDPVARRGIAENREYLVDLVERSVIARHPDVDDAAMLAALRGDIGALDKETYNALFRALKLMCFFQ